MKRALPALALLLAACGGTPTRTPPPDAPANAPSSQAPQGTPTAGRTSPYAPAQEDPSKRGDYVAGGLYAPHIRDSAPPDIHDVDRIPEPEVRAEPRSRYGNRDYKVLGKQYRVLDDPKGYVETGLASYYGTKFHGRRTSSLEVYDMYAFTAAHKTLPLPSFARVTNLSNGKSVIVRVNDRGPFHAGRVIDLSYAAAVKLGVHPSGTAKVEVRALTVDGRGPDMRVAPASSVPPTLVAPIAPSAMDRMVAALPIASVEAGERKSAAAEPEPTPPGPWRFDMKQDGKAMTADEFDAWMKARRVRVATGEPGKPLSEKAGNGKAGSKSGETGDMPATALRQTPAEGRGAAGPPVSRFPLSASASASEAPVTLQIASFAARANAERALAMLEDAGIRDARLLDAVASGQKVWRLRVGPVAADRVPELSSTVTGLGFGRPNIVRD